MFWDTELVPTDASKPLFQIRKTKGYPLVKDSVQALESLTLARISTFP